MSTKNKIQELQQSLTGDMEKDAPIREEIHKLKMQDIPEEETDTCSLDDEECLSCGS